MEKQLCRLVGSAVSGIDGRALWLFNACIMAFSSISTCMYSRYGFGWLGVHIYAYV